MGLADLFLLRKTPYGSKESLAIIDEVFGFMRKIALDESEKLGEKLGVPSQCQKLPNPRRNITTLTVAPTGSIALIAGCNSGIEPIFSEFTTRKDNTGTYQIFHPDYEEPYFRCAVASNGAEEVTWKEHILVQNQVQKYIDSGVSKTINFPNKTHRDTIADSFMFAYDLGYVKGMTIYRNGSREIEVLSPKNLKKDKCPVCGEELIKESGCKHCSSCDFSVCEIG
jgi:ribonucleoside-diphosphate reductase alpha chain